MAETKPTPDAYAAAGVDIAAGESLVEAIKPLAKSTERAGVVGGLGGFGGLFDLAACGYRDPLLVAATDGVGTKLKIAQATGRFDTIGIDLVAMCVNDLIVQGAEPLFFLDYYATGKLDEASAAQVISGIAEGCRQAGAALIGGETAEMPGLYQGTDFDLAGFSVGAVERTALLPRNVAPGDKIIGMPSSGLHSNGFSLVRKIIADRGLDYTSPAPFDQASALGEALLTPTRIYVQPLLPLIRAGDLKALAHITGGGLTENLPRILADEAAAAITLEAVPFPPVMAWLAKAGGLSEAELVRTFNAGIGMVLIVEPNREAAVRSALEAAGEAPVSLGSLIPRSAGDPAVAYSGRLSGDGESP